MPASITRNLITGGAGFVGSHLVDRLMQAGEEVICLDNYFTGRKSNIAEWIGHPRFELIRHDVTEPIWLEVDRIWHLACPASPVHYQFNPIKTAKTSFLGTYNMLGLARRVGARLLMASTSEIYGDPEVHPQPESYRGCVNTIGIRSCYDEGKRAAETLCADYLREYGVDVRLVRIFNTYGPNMHPQDGRVISNFIMQALRSEDITIYGNGEQTRSFQYVDDLIDALLALMGKPRKELKAACSEAGFDIPVVNIGNPGEFTIKALAETILELIPESTGKLVFRPLPKDDPQRRKPDIALAKSLLGWVPKIPLKQGLTQTIAYFRTRA